MNPNTELDLNDPRVFEELKKHDVNRVQPAVAAAVKEKQKAASVTVKLSSDEVALCTRAALESGAEDFKAWLITEIRSKILNAKVGSPKFGGPSWKQTVTGPSEGANFR